MNTHGIIAQISRIREHANIVIEQELRDRAIKGILPSHGAVLYFLFKQSEPVPIKEIVTHTGRVKSTITGVLNTLERHGYIQKVTSDTDNRVTLVELSDKGQSIREDFDAISDKLLDMTYGDMSSNERAELVELLNRMERNLAVREQATA